MTSGNVLEIYKTKKIKSVSGLLQTDSKTAWLWVLSLLGIVAFPPSLLFISEFMIVKSMIVQNKILLCIVFLVLLTIILYGIAKPVIKMVFSPVNVEKNEEQLNNVKKLNWTMYLPQVALLIVVFYLGIFMPDFIVKYAVNSIIGLG